MDEPLAVGADWSGAGWFAVAFAGETFDHAAVLPEIGDIWARYRDEAETVLLDVPIGLLEGGERAGSTDAAGDATGASGREVDRLARSVLGDRSASVFSPPVREAAHKQRYAAANRTNERLTGRGLSKQAFHVSDPIAAVDDLLQQVPEARELVAEAHPEVSFRAFGGAPLAHSKRRAGGYAERLAILEGIDPDAPAAVRAAAAAAGGADVAVDDVLDATVLAYAAGPGPGERRTLPPDPPTDPTGLPMRMVYRSEAPLVE